MLLMQRETTMITATRTHQSRTHHITHESLPLVRLSDTHSLPFEVVQFEGRAVYLYVDGAGEAQLCLEAVALDHGDNEIGRWTAPATPSHDGGLVGDKAVAFVDEL